MRTIRKKLLKWFGKHQRNYPWRTTDNWFHLLIAEMMLRRTRADQVLAVYEDFTGSYSTPQEAQREAPQRLQEVLAPLGLRWRSSQMQQTIAYLQEHHSDTPPQSEEEFLQIPGVGDYAASMLRNRLYNEPVATIDSNVTRVVCRLFGHEWSPESRRKQEIRSLAHDLVKTKDSKELNLALLDLSALVCRPQKPLCSDCPLQKECAFPGDR